MKEKMKKLGWSILPIIATVLIIGCMATPNKTETAKADYTEQEIIQLVINMPTLQAYENDRYLNQTSGQTSGIENNRIYNMYVGNTLIINIPTSFWTGPETPSINIIDFTELESNPYPIKGTPKQIQWQGTNEEIAYQYNDYIMNNQSNTIKEQWRYSKNSYNGINPTTSKITWECVYWTINPMWQFGKKDNSSTYGISGDWEYLLRIQIYGTDENGKYGWATPISMTFDNPYKYKEGDTPFEVHLYGSMGSGVYNIVRGSGDNNNQGYTQGYNQGYNEGFSEGQTNGFKDGKQIGYQQGLTDATNLGENPFWALTDAVMFAPVKALQGILNFNIFGTNILGVVTALLTIALIINIIRLVL